MGPSGSGKSTLLHILAGLDRPTAGWVEIAGTRLDELADRDLTLLRRRQVGFIFQSYNLLPVLTAEENIAAAAAGSAATRPTGLARDADRDGRARGPPHAPARRAVGRTAAARRGCARARSRGPAVVFADEPTGNLDSDAGREVLELLRRAVDEFGQTIVMVTHDAGAAAIADRSLFLADGQIVDELTRPVAASRSSTT